MSAVLFFSILAGCIVAGLIEAVIESRMERKFDEDCDQNGEPEAEAIKPTI